MHPLLGRNERICYFFFMVMVWRAMCRLAGTKSVTTAPVVARRMLSVLVGLSSAAIAAGAAGCSGDASTTTTTTTTSPHTGSGSPFSSTAVAPVPMPANAQPVPGQSGLFLVRDATTAWTSHWAVTVATRAPATAVAPIARCFAEFETLERILSEWDPASEVSRINAAAGEAPVPVSPELLRTIQVALEVGALTDGGFDLTFLPLGRLWKLEDPAPTLPNPEALAAAKALVDYRKVRIDPAAGTVFIEVPGMQIGLGGIGQGVAVDRCAAILRGAGLTDFIVDGSGDVFISGSKGEIPWRAGIAHPRRPGVQFAKFFPPQGAMVTSGDYERFAVIEGERYHHIIDPATGYPVAHTASVTLFAPTATFADALSTGLFVLGSEKGMPVVESRSDLEAVFVDLAGTVHLSSGSKGRVTGVPASLDMTVPAGTP